MGSSPDHETDELSGLIDADFRAVEEAEENAGLITLQPLNIAPKMTLDAMFKA